ncbi:PEP-CTERM sorting domain-containing protein [Tautonia rosea]|uniref:PEP-CTERM sorting domain-containing protein n=1 Tax=Tautonia rosea TaxID=2728037 RepID=UPI00147400EE|nr:PEP-CTERM sorting domain-containing protein [Tautonia rosea]
MTRQHLPLAAVTLLGVVFSGVASQVAEAGFILREVKAQEVLDPIGLYQAELFLVGPPGTFFQGSSNPADRDYITIYNIPDLAGDVSKPVGWLSNPEIITPGLPPGFNDPAIPNLTFSFIAGDRIFIPTGKTELFVGIFSWQTFESARPPLVPRLNYSWQTSRLVNGVETRETGFGSVKVFIIPEPASLLMTAAGLGLVGGLVRRRRRSRRPVDSGTA